MLSKSAFARLILSVAAAVLAQDRAFAQDAAAVLKRASDAMGATNLKSIRYTAEGTGYTFGQAFKPGMPWPKINVHSQTRTINYDTASMRDEIVLSRGEPRGGGGYPHVAQQRTDQYVSGAFAWNQLATAPLPGPRFVADRVHQLWITPHGAVKAAIKNNATAQPGKPRGCFVCRAGTLQRYGVLQCRWPCRASRIARARRRPRGNGGRHDLLGLSRLCWSEIPDPDPANPGRLTGPRCHREGSPTECAGRYSVAGPRARGVGASDHRESRRWRLVRRRRDRTTASR